MWKILLIAILAINNCNAVLEADANTLVLLDNLAIRETHSIFFKSLQGNRHTVFSLSHTHTHTHTCITTDVYDFSSNRSWIQTNVQASG